ncbi:MAG TPA: penicillin acylase family protein [Mycobacteriales bacterium]|nr:penicillin acylase family protein [Mycobacteriales bacterium]
MKITWDEWAVPTVVGDDDLDAVYGMGYAQAVAVGGDVLELYGMARGKAASYWGGGFLKEDLFTASLGLDAKTDEWFAHQTAETRERIAAFCNGFNAACEEDESRAAARREALPITPRDVIAHVLRVFVRFNQIDGQRLAFDPVDFYGHTLAGSNSWAIAAEKSTTGNALVMINPHLSWSIKYHRFIEMRSISPTRTFDGVTLIGVPWQSMGHSNHVAWAHTVNPIRNLVVFELKNVADNQYDFDGQRLAFETIEHTINVRDGEPVTVVERRSVHGPVLTAPDGADVAVRIAGVLNHPAYNALDSWWEMSLAKDLEEMFATHDRKWLPMFNITAGDSSGSVGALYCGTPPVRASWADTVRRLPGDDPALLADEVYPASAMPRVIDPECGWVTNCNDTPFLWCDPPLNEADYPPAIAPGVREVDDIRPLVSRDWLKRHETVSPEQLLELKFHKRAVLADIVLDELLTAAKVHADLEEAIDVLAAWDRQMNSDSAGYPLFLMWLLASAPAMLAKELVIEGDEPGALPTGLQDATAAAATLQAAVLGFSLLGLPLNASIGDLMTLGEGGDAVPADGGSGLVGSLKSFEILPGPAGGFVVGVADTYVSRVELRDDQAPITESLLVYGNTTEPGAPPSPSQFKVWAADQLRAK